MVNQCPTKELCIPRNYNIKFKMNFFSIYLEILKNKQLLPPKMLEGIGKRSTCEKWSPAPSRKSQWERGPAGRTHAHGKALPWGIRPALNLGCYETCLAKKSLTLDGGGKRLLGIFNFLQSVLNHPVWSVTSSTAFPLQL